MFRAFSIAAAVAAFLVVVLGSWVRINGAGMTCPDWPLCHGALIPSLAGGVVLEWSHRLLALVTGVLVLPALWTGWQARKRIGGVSLALALVCGLFTLRAAAEGLRPAVASRPSREIANGS